MVAFEKQYRFRTEGKLPKNVGVVGSEYCAELYDLNIIERDIHDLKHNLTLFLSVEKMEVIE